MTNLHLRVGLIFLMSLSIAVCARTGRAEDAGKNLGPEDYAKKYAEWFKAFDKAEVTIYHIDSSDEKPKEGDKRERFHGFPILGHKECPAESVAKVIATLSDAKSYKNEYAKCFEPGLAFRFKKGDKVLDLVICLMCNYVKYYDGEKSEMWPLSKEGNAKLLQVFKASFPETKE